MRSIIIYYSFYLFAVAAGVIFHWMHSTEASTFPLYNGNVILLSYAIGFPIIIFALSVYKKQKILINYKFLCIIALIFTCCIWLFMIVEFFHQWGISDGGSYTNLSIDDIAAGLLFALISSPFSLLVPPFLLLFVLVFLLGNFPILLVFGR